MWESYPKWFWLLSKMRSKSGGDHRFCGEEAEKVGEQQFAPRPAEVQAAILRNPRVAPVGRQVSLRVCEMEAEVRVYLRDRSVPAEEVAEGVD